MNALYDEDVSATVTEQSLIDQIHELECHVNDLEEHIDKCEERITELEGSWITRLEVISRGVGRYYVNTNVCIEKINIQDHGRTMKIFIKENKHE